jgi:uncharacterized protein (TIGR03435 family)
VASVKPVLDAPPNAQMNGEINHGRLTLNNARLSQIIAVAYNVQGSRVVEGPEWLDSELFQSRRKGGGFGYDRKASPRTIRLL